MSSFSQSYSAFLPSAYYYTMKSKFKTTRIKISKLLRSISPRKDNFAQKLTFNEKLVVQEPVERLQNEAGYREVADLLALEVLEQLLEGRVLRLRQGQLQETQNPEMLLEIPARSQSHLRERELLY